MKTVILAGGYGSRLDEITKIIPKPLVKVGNYPILVHILKIFIRQNHTNFVIALGYKGEKIVEYFLKKKVSNKIKKKLKNGFELQKKILNKNCKITFLNTGLKTMTGGRVKRASKIINDESFFCTYGDGVANVDLSQLLRLHKQKKKLVTITAVNPPARFGELKINKKNKVINFSEKKPIKSSWINGGFFVINKKFSNYIKNDKSILEREPLETITKIGQLNAYKHKGFWQCMDTKRDKDILHKILKKKF